LGEYEYTGETINGIPQGMGRLSKEGQEIYGTFNKGFLEGKGMIITD
jgi:hypothetical protein